MRVLMIALGLAVFAVVALAALSWLADRQLDRDAAPYMTADIALLPAADVALVLGAAPIGPEGGPNRYLAYRLDAAAALWKSGKARYLIASGNREGDYDEPTYMRAQLIERGVSASVIYCDFAGVRTRESVVRAQSIYGQTRFIIVSQRFHVARALFLARREGLDAWGFEARDVDRPYSILTGLRRYPSALRAFYDVWTETPPRQGGKPVAIGVDPPG